MWWIFVFLFVATAGATEDDDFWGSNCMSRIYSECEKSGKPPEDLPGTEEELEEACKFVVEYFDCAEKIIETCSDTSPHVEDIKALSPLFRSVCVKDSPLFSAVVESFGCFKQNRHEAASCYRDVDVFSVADTLDNIGITNLDDSEDKNDCLATLYRASCITAKAGKACGDVAKDILLTFFTRFVSPYDSCPENLQEHIPDIVKVLETEEEKGEAVENAIKRKK